MQMITLTTSESQVPGDIVEAAGGFFWWYVDVIDAQGDGFVIIAAFGLPFLPGYADAARRGEAPPPSERPSLNVCVYDRGELDF